MPGTPKTVSGPAYLTNAAANLYTPPASTMYLAIRGLVFCNKDTATHYITVYRGATGGSAGGTELLKLRPLLAGETWVMPFPGQGLMMSSADFLSGLADANSVVTVTVIADQYVTP